MVKLSSEYYAKIQNIFIYTGRDVTSNVYPIRFKDYLALTSKTRSAQTYMGFVWGNK